ncbi:hypothetical protein A2382_03740 [Candidatus Woesebacteria bacterium RIFOXYB1_FULL_38_16]|uniref:PDZ domain-containing protein n=1 Tax=Candidatus Woesebacteria bacterium RIFOXYB1_FULL_38_16 TaxID=1802538 RepID=A0A1F8CR51_9BACT|nr:MAG: hypothetical protein A2191_02230 [Candidatus Woesebacteria bacterium RIFOXYA1_FULL_38_9]OGM78762.1 MAG: hypothetical protein A2382_03740 [Candidatus Woesebacteria bacterium RIFOXYB1_FULL_38_16]
MIKFTAPSVSVQTVKKTFLYLVFSITLLTSGYVVGATTNQPNESKNIKVTLNREVPADKNLDFSLFWKVWDALEDSYFDKSHLIASDMVYGAIKGMVAAVDDPYTVFLTPNENKIVQEDLNGNFDGVGVQIGFQGKQLAVVAALTGSPAQKAGIMAGDLIVGIKDEKKGVDRTTANISLPEAVQIIRGPAGTTVTLALLRDGTTDPIIVDLTRESIFVPSVTLKYVGQENKIAHLSISKFGAETYTEWDKAVRELLQNQALKGVIVDVRNNTGGYLQASVDIASEFITAGNVIVIEEQAGNARHEFKVNRVGRLIDTPVVMLVNQGSASASEILAGALKDQKEVKLIGKKTFGKGTIQEPQRVDGGGGLHITIAKWLTPKGTWVNEKGLDPDFDVDDNPDTIEDEQLLKAIEVLGK